MGADARCAACRSQVSPKLNDIAKDADFIVLEGMGRGIETNLWGQFKVAALKVGLIKHREVAMELEGGVTRRRMESTDSCQCLYSSYLCSLCDLSRHIVPAIP